MYQRAFHIYKSDFYIINKTKVNKYGQIKQKLCLSCYHVICTVNKICILRQISIKDVLHCKIWLVYITRNTLQRCISRGDFQMGIPHFQMAVLRIQCRPKYVGGYCGADCLKGMQNTIVRVECQILIKRNGVGGVRGSPTPPMQSQLFPLGSYMNAFSWKKS